MEKDDKIVKVGSYGSDSASVRETSIEDPHTVHLKHIVNEGDLDKAAKFDRPDEPMPPGMNRRLQLKADIYITTFMGLVYSIQFADKTLNSAATTMHLREDLDMVDGSGYAWSGSAFYLGYLAFVFPMSYLIMKAPLAQTTGAVIAVWGITIILTAACTNMAGYLTLRTLLGALESTIMPAYTVLTSQYYPRDQQYQRTLMWFSMNGLGTILSNSLGIGLLNRSSLPLHGWKLLYLIMGAISIVMGIVFFFYMPNSPAEAWFYTEEEKRWQVERIRDNKQGYGSDKIKWYQVKEAFLDIHTWLYCFTVFVNNIPNGAITTMLNLLLEGFNYDKKDSLVMALPCGGSEVVGLLLVAVASSYILPKNRLIWSCTAAACNVVCLCLVTWGPNAGAKLAGIYIYYTVSPTSYVGLVSCIASNSAGHTKKMTSAALFYIFYCVGNLVGPQTFKSSEAPEYPTGKKAMAAASCIQLFLECMVMVSYICHNIYKDRKNQRLPEDLDNPEFADLTDKENPEFRYAL